MTLTDLASIGSFISGIAVAASLIYLALQVHQNSKHTRALIQQGRTARLCDHQMRCAGGEMAAAIITGNGGKPTPEAVLQHQFERYCWATLFSLEDSFVQGGDGLLSEEQIQSFRRGVNGVMSQPGLRAHYQASRASWGNSRFAKFVDDTIAKAPGELPHEPVVGPSA